MDEIVIKKMLQKALLVKENSYAPYSHFKVGACIRTDNDELFSGCNVENASFSLTLCAEANAIGHVIAAGRKKITDVVIVGTGPQLCFPCGSCRQKLHEFSDANTCIHLFDDLGQNYKKLTLDELLPYAFSSKNLEKK